MEHKVMMTIRIIVLGLLLVVLGTTGAYGQDRLYAYPTQGQSQGQLARDRGECHGWAVRQTGFDPTAIPFEQRGRGVVVAEPIASDPAATILTGTVVGSVLGTAVGAIAGDAGAGAVIGAALGLFDGIQRAEVAEAREIAVHRQRAGADARWQARRQAYLAQQYSRYNRALSACLEGRGYTVR